MILTAAEIQAIIPNRYPICYIDGVTHFIPDQSLKAFKNVTVNEKIVLGSQGQPYMPQMLVIETLAQAASILILKSPQFAHKTAYLGGIPQATFGRLACPGDRLDLAITMVKVRENMGMVHCDAQVDHESVCETDLMFIVAPDQVSVVGLEKE